MHHAQDEPEGIGNTYDILSTSSFYYPWLNDVMSRRLCSLHDNVGSPHDEMPRVQDRMRGLRRSAAGRPRAGSRQGTCLAVTARERLTPVPAKPLQGGIACKPRKQAP